METHRNIPPPSANPNTRLDTSHCGNPQVGGIRFRHAGLVCAGCWKVGFGADASIKYLPACARENFTSTFERSCIDPITREVREGGGNFEDVVAGARS
ncbi:hypothetical protein C7212DRAFT_186675 [Tuber magnatum]|uniref:Uncharacterized protein n=1 Tax=Tuber magnatum TaxID=42249 RepID=A0A317SPN2_9PEZI|nr:hypothetical protein C7212DRAFT_186675 [Tuber magnatum]